MSRIEEIFEIFWLSARRTRKGGIPTLRRLPKWLPGGVPEAIDTVLYRLSGKGEDGGSL